MAIGDESSPSSSVPVPPNTVNGDLGTGTTSFSIIDHNHLLFLQPTDTPGSTLISLQLTRSDNYALWSRAMRIGLLGKSKLGFVNGRFPKIRFEPELHDQWEKVDVVILPWIMNSIRPGLLSSVLYACDAHKVWEDLKERFNKFNGSRVLYLHREIHSLTQGTMTIADYFSKSKDLWDKFDALMPCPKSKKYSQHFEANRLLQFLIGLNETYAQARSQIMMMSHVPSINKAYALLVDQESQRILATCQQSMLITKGIESTILYNNRGNEASGGYPPDFKTKKKGSTTPGLYANGVSGVDFSLLLKGNEEAPGSSSRLAVTGTPITLMTSFINKNWIIDTGASNHMASRIDMLNSHSTINKESKNVVHLSNGEMVFVIHKGKATDLYSSQVKGIGRENHELYILQGEGLQNSSTLSEGRYLSTIDVSSSCLSLVLEEIYPFKHIKQITNPLFLVLEFVSDAIDNSVHPCTAPQSVIQSSPGTSADDIEDDHCHIPNTTKISTISEDLVVDLLISHELRKSSRTSRPYLWLQDYVVHSKGSKCAYPISAHWVEAMKLEITTLEDNHTWSIVDLPTGKKPIGYKWIFKIKHKASGEIERFKWFIYQTDVHNAFLNDVLLEEVYMVIPEGFARQGKNQKVCKLHKSLYGLKQAHRQWNMKLTESLVSMGFEQSHYDYFLFTKKTAGDVVIILVYVDDLLITGNNPSLISDTRCKL
ncbi:uncharacterized protein LOC142176789 [Nicotiana tabacum]|uniref:Uncharacterized protein LOC142176789 n=1 Tax=Nicotiana tabacum TaxID=4097 RepID=A0AC58TVL0_TOBAC